MPQGPGPIAYGPRTSHQDIGAPRGSGARGYADWQYAGKIFAQRADTLGNTIGLGITGRRLITQASPSTRSPEVCTKCQWWTVHVHGHFLAGQAPDPPPSQTTLVNAQRYTDLQVQLEYSNGSPDNERVNLDIGPGFGLSFWGSAPKVWLLLDQAMGIYSPGDPNSPIPGVGTLRSHMISATLECSRAYTSRALWQVTTTFQNIAATVELIEVQPRAQYVEVFQTADGPPAVSFDFDGLARRVYTFDGTTRHAPRVRIPGDANFIATRPSVPNDLRIFSVIQEVEL